MDAAVEILPLHLTCKIVFELGMCLCPFKASADGVRYYIGKEEGIGSLVLIFGQDTNQKHIEYPMLSPEQ